MKVTVTVELEAETVLTGAMIVAAALPSDSVLELNATTYDEIPRAQICDGDGNVIRP